MKTLPLNDVDNLVEKPSTSAVDDFKECSDDLEENDTIASSEQENKLHSVLFQKYFRIIERKSDIKQNISTICLTCEKISDTPVVVRGSLLATSNFIRHLRVMCFNYGCK